LIGFDRDWYHLKISFDIIEPDKTDL
jgi:hypothetical protein